jgi:hypothetical protein
LNCFLTQSRKDAKNCMGWGELGRGAGVIGVGSRDGMGLECRGLPRRREEREGEGGGEVAKGGKGRTGESRGAGAIRKGMGHGIHGRARKAWGRSRGVRGETARGCG